MAFNNAINAPFPFTVAQGGTGVITLTTPYGVLCAGTTATGAIQTLASLGASGTVLTSNGAAALPSFQALPAGGMTWSEVTGTSQALAVNSGYVMNNAGLVTGTLPATAAIGDTIALVGKGAGGWRMTANTGQVINFGNVASTSAGSVSSSAQFDTIEVVCITANTTWVVRHAVGNQDIT